MSSRVNLFFKYLLEPSYHLEKLKLPLSLFLISNTIHIGNGINIFKSMWFEYVMCLSEMFLGPETQFSSMSCLRSSLFNLFNMKNKDKRDVKQNLASVDKNGSKLLECNYSDTQLTEEFLILQFQHFLSFVPD